MQVICTHYAGGGGINGKDPAFLLKVNEAAYVFRICPLILSDDWLTSAKMKLQERIKLRIKSAHQRQSYISCR